MSTTLILPDGFLYLAPAFMSTVFLALGQSLTVGRYRKRAKIAYPQMYAEAKEAEASRDAHLFNCAQRAHQNTLENIPWIYAITLVTGMKYPVYASAALGMWTVGRISYSRGYLTGDPAKRGDSMLFRVGLLSASTLLLTSTYISGEILFNGLSSKFF